MASVQDLVHKIDQGTGQRQLKIGLILLVLLFLFVGYNLRSYRNMSTQEGIDAAQLARNIAEGKGYTTDFIRPLSVHLLSERAQAKARRGAPLPEDPGRIRSPHPDISNPPVYPLLLAGLMKIVPLDFDASTDTPKRFWHRQGKFWRYQPDFVIAMFNQMLMVLTIYLSYRLAKRLFDGEVALLTALALLGIEMLWRFSVSGLSTMLLMLIMVSSLWLVALIEERLTSQATPGKGVLPLALLLGAVVGIGALTRYSFAWLIIPVIVFFLLYGGRWRIVPCLAVVAAFLVVLTPWMYRNFNLSGQPFGTATYAPIEDTSLFPGNRLERSMDLQIEKGIVNPLRYKLVQNLRAITQDDVLKMGGTWVTFFFIVSAVVAFRRSGTRRLRWFLFLTLGVFILVQALGKTHLSDDSRTFNSENLLILLVPGMVIYGVAIFFMLLDSIVWPIRQLRNVAVGVFAVIAAMPLLLTLAPPRPSAVAYPPYYPPAIQSVCEWMDEDDLIMSDIPWAVAWYGRRQSIWLTLDAKDSFYAINDYQRPIKALYLTPVTMDSKFLTQWVRPGEDSWGSFILQTMIMKEVPTGFPLQKAPAGFWPEQLFLTDWERWKMPETATTSR